MAASRSRHQLPLFPPLLALACLLLAGCAQARQDVQVDSQEQHATIELPGEGPFQRFIVRYRDGSPSAADPALVPGHLRRTAAAAGFGDALAPAWQRRLAVGGDVFVLDRALDREATLRLMRAFAADPQVESIEVDRRLGIDPSAGRRMRER